MSFLIIILFGNIVAVKSIFGMKCGNAMWFSPVNCQCLFQGGGGTGGGGRFQTPHSELLKKLCQVYKCAIDTNTGLKIVFEFILEGLIFSWRDGAKPPCYFPSVWLAGETGSGCIAGLDSACTWPQPPHKNSGNKPWLSSVLLQPFM